MIPGGKYAALPFEGTGAEIGAAWDALLRDWLPKSGLQLDSRPFFEHYPVDGRYDPKTGRFTLRHLRARGCSVNDGAGPETGRPTSVHCDFPVSAGTSYCKRRRQRRRFGRQRRRA